MANGTKWLFRQARVRTGTSGIARLLHSRHCIDLQELPEDLRDAYLRETEQTRQLPPGSTNLVALFSRVPVEIVSEIRFEPEQMILLFGLVPMSGRRRTRIYDLAVVVEKENGKLHLVPHRTRYHTIFLDL